jgi:hypothetical protein
VEDRTLVSATVDGETWSILTDPSHESVARAKKQIRDQFDQKARDAEGARLEAATE